MVAVVVGTDEDPQNLNSQVEFLAGGISTRNIGPLTLEITVQLFTPSGSQIDSINICFGDGVCRKISGFDLTGQPKEATGTDLLARIWQHETDHLDGVLVIDGMSEMTELENRKTIRQLEADFSSTRR